MDLREFTKIAAKWDKLWRAGKLGQKELKRIIGGGIPLKYGHAPRGAKTYKYKKALKSASYVRASGKRAEKDVIRNVRTRGTLERITGKYKNRSAIKDRLMERRKELTGTHLPGHPRLSGRHRKELIQIGLDVPPRPMGRKMFAKEIEAMRRARK